MMEEDSPTRQRSPRNTARYPPEASEHQGKLFMEEQEIREDTALQLKYRPMNMMFRRKLRLTSLGEDGQQAHGGDKRTQVGRCSPGHGCLHSQKPRGCMRTRLMKAANRTVVIETRAPIRPRTSTWGGVNGVMATDRVR
ncbi:hypothetical protein MUK42_37105 [Musa troglodytarum]|uniref:Uncharacterized protein n=1 Tax=Musa troglodytarum TaxID=320322 RepID=A0A9E7H1C7_9LILI|nr:hypothetical protein MUK42_37105 [Musa troglodytarum]